MLAWLKKKTAERVEMEKAACAAVDANPYVFKRVKKLQRRSFYRRWGLRLAFSLAATGVTTAAPDLVSQPLDQHMAGKGLQDGLQQHFATKDIRVYHRRNPLMPFHLAGQAARISWQDSSGYFFKPLVASFSYASGLVMGFGGVVLPSALDAYSIADGMPLDKRQCFIRPPARVTSAVLFESFTGLAAKDVADDQAKDIERYYYQLVMAHEARHCDQDKQLSASAVHEIDADLVADRLTAGMLPEADRQGYREYWANLRLIGAVVGQDAGHYSTIGLRRGTITPLQALQDASAVKKLIDVLRDAESKNPNFGRGMTSLERRYHLSRKLLNVPGVDDRELRQKAVGFVEAVLVMNELADGGVITTEHEKVASQIDFGWLTRQGSFALPQQEQRPAPTATPQARPAA